MTFFFSTTSVQKWNWHGQDWVPLDNCRTTGGGDRLEKIFLVPFCSFPYFSLYLLSAYEISLLPAKIRVVVTAGLGSQLLVQSTAYYPIWVILPSLPNYNLSQADISPLGHGSAYKKTWCSHCSNSRSNWQYGHICQSYSFFIFLLSFFLFFFWYTCQILVEMDLSSRVIYGGVIQYLKGESSNHFDMKILSDLDSTPSCILCKSEQARLNNKGDNDNFPKSTLK